MNLKLRPFFELFFYYLNLLIIIEINYYLLLKNLENLLNVLYNINYYIFHCL